jgi:NSS family neurotransmitter:Na+ symporter
VVYKGIQKGIEYWSRLMTSTLLVILIGLFCYSLTLDGLQEALHYLFYPDIKRFSITALLEALGLSLFTLSLGESIMVTYGSYMKKSEDIPKVVGIVSLMNIVVSFLAALMIFPNEFSFGLSPQGGAGLVFETLPVLFSRLPGSMLLSTLFFVLLSFTAITSGIGLLETVVANCTDLYQWSRRKTVIYIGVAIFVCGIPSALATTGDVFPTWSAMYGKNFFQTMGALVTNWLMPLNALFVALFLGWGVKKKVVYDEYSQGAAVKVGRTVWYFFIRYLVPIAILLIILGKTGLVDLEKLVG